MCSSSDRCSFAYVHVNILLCHPCWLDNPRLKFHQWTICFVDGDRLSGKTHSFWSAFTGISHSNGIISICLETGFHCMYFSTVSNPFFFSLFKRPLPAATSWLFLLHSRQRTIRQMVRPDEMKDLLVSWDTSSIRSPCELTLWSRRENRRRKQKETERSAWNDQYGVRVQST